MKKLAAFIVLMLASAIFAPDWAGCASAPEVTRTLCNSIATLCNGVQTLIPVASMLMLVIAAVIYAAGQMMGAETRARANVWATAALTGALIGILIVAIAPTVLKAIYTGDGSGAIDVCRTT